MSASLIKHRCQSRCENNNVLQCCKSMKTEPRSKNLDSICTDMLKSKFDRRHSSSSSPVLAKSCQSRTQYSGETGRNDHYLLPSSVNGSPTHEMHHIADQLQLFRILQELVFRSVGFGCFAREIRLPRIEMIFSSPQFLRPSPSPSPSLV